MGNRSSIKITQPWAVEPIYLYTHWEGHRICALLANGVLRAELSGRSKDPSYATRIIFDELTECSRTETGFGISSGHPDDEDYDIPEVWWTNDNRMGLTYKGLHFSPSEFLERFLREPVSK
jgi:hypothetical protein